MKAYVASGWFSDNQEIARLSLLRVLTNLDIEYYSPKDENLLSESSDTPQLVFDENIIQILASTFVLASTVEKDVGTMFECGFAYSHSIPIVYYFPYLSLKFNLMLSKSAHAVCQSEVQLQSYLSQAKTQRKIFKRPYTGVIE